jgi:hypothetical protein
VALTAAAVIKKPRMLEVVKNALGKMTQPGA